MDIVQLRRLKPRLRHFLKSFDGCFARKTTRAHLPIYITGQLSDLPDKSVEPIAVEAGVAPRTLQEFLSQLKWDEDWARDQLHEIVRTNHSGPHTIGIIDETSYVKKGDKTPGVKRQWCGAVGKKENCVVTVHLGYAHDDFHCLLDSELYLPEDWARDRDRCDEAGIPKDMTYRPKWEIALELYDRSVAHGLHFAWMTFDEWYGGKPDFLRGLSARQQRYVGEVPKNLVGWIKPPRIITRPYHKNRRGFGRKIPRLASGSSPARRVDQLLGRRELRDQPWQRWRVKDGEKGPMVWEIKHVRFSPKDAAGLPCGPLHLVVAREVLHPEEIKYFVSNAAPETSVQTLLLVAFSRWRVERCFEDQKGEVGLDHYEGRRYLGLKRHLILSAISYLFLAETRQEFGGEKSGVDGVPGAYRDCRPDPTLVAGRESLEEVTGTHGGEASKDSMQECSGKQESHQTHASRTPTVRYQTQRASPVYLGKDIAL